ncbi:MAG: DEAD/DEAH box helicase [Pyrinomonadaceae bacterium]|nr:DEAD/DEAH box helicase [Chloracidobacterium sp.]MBP9935795.1 DEAD/DEAH box helicase [Pyrinomonadaceae bacterium]
MSQTIQIQTETNIGWFRLTGNVLELLDNPRIMFALRRMKFETDENAVLVPYEEKTKIQTLQELQRLLERFSFGSTLSAGTRDDVSSFEREESTFREFSERARSIRNDQFQIVPDLVSYFDDFQKVVKNTLVRPLYPRQLLSAFHMAFSQNACNFAVPGAGKTSIVYGAYSYLRGLPETDPKHVNKLMVLGPLSSFAPWENEYKDCFGKEIISQRLSGEASVSREQKEQHLFSTNPAELTLIFHGGVVSLQNEIISFLNRNKTMVVIDEAHRIKNPDGVWGRSAIEIAKAARSRIILTGTPVPNGYEDLFNLFQFLYPYRYKSILKAHYGNLVEMTKSASYESDSVKNFIENISPYFIRIKKSDLKLPRYFEHSIDVVMNPIQREIYDFIETKSIRLFETNSTATVKDLLNRAKLIRLRQAASNPSLLLKPLAETLYENDYEFNGTLGENLPDELQNDSQILSKLYTYQKNETPQKFTVVKELLDQILSKKGGKAIVWTIFVQNAKQLQLYLLNNEIVSKLLIGEVDQPSRELIVEEFNNPTNTDFRVVIANPFAVSESISLHMGCHNAIYLERDYNCANFLQSRDRIHRYGLPPNQETHYYYLISSNSIDGVIDDKLKRKVQRMERIIDEEIPLFSRLDDSDETDLIMALINDYARRS